MTRKHICIDRTQYGAATLRTILLLFTGSLLVVILVAGFITSYGYFRTYVSEQLAGHARDGATAVGLSLSNAIDARDPVAAASLIDAVFDSGRYLSVRYLNHQGSEVAGREMTLADTDVPPWFRTFADLELTVAEAEVVRGWSRLGKVEVVSNPGRAYTDLWRITVGLVASTAIIGGVGLFALFLLLKRTLRPLRALERQAQALGRRNFRQRVTVRSTREVNQVTAAMNQMADDLGQLFEGQAKLIQHLRRVNNEDPVTGLASRSAFDQRLKVEVESEEKAAPGVLILVQLWDFATYNHTYGRSEADRLLLRAAAVINGFVTAHMGSFAGRRNGAEFSIYVPGAMPADAGIWCQDLVTELDGVYADLAAPLETAVHAGLARTGDGRGTRELLAAADEALRLAQRNEETGCHLAEPDKEGHHNLETWRVIISQAIREQSLSLWLQPMISEHQSQPVYHQVFSRIEGPDGPLKAGAFIPMAERFGLISDIDRLLIQRVLKRLAERPDEPLAVSLSSASVASESFRKEMLAMLEAAGPGAANLWIGISEHTIHHHRTAVGLLVRALVRLGVPVLVDRFGVGGVPFSYLRNLSVQALRIDNSFIHDIDTHDDNRFYLESVVSIAHSRGVKVFATGVETSAEYSVVCKLGIDGAMGYHLGRPFAADNQPTGE
ncbi:bifunctional diguanylate cyclase/phosphodiesterase [Marinobacter sp. F4206]|uniref:bifunctional diguanylate cyclase/phosphodiesterase n=1 Tax=Marinobacter sp. F4206 TaxID=2861777 RepID=UPI001C5D072E|nr:EAL domain-containing protein [Marinobacter sp. F4206]MBW4934563.1 EAL domain-containing protein [Marinobacter sp. F4206]